MKNNIINFNNRTGIKLNDSSTHNNISGNTASKNKKGGINLVMRSNNNIIASNTITLNKNFGIGIEESSSGNLIYNNFLNNTNNSKNDGGNTWNITKTAGRNIIGGPYLGGNFWASPTGAGFSQKCADGNRDGICDSSYPVPVGDIDLLPLAKDGAPPKSVSNLKNISYATSYINWTWTDPADPDFVNVSVWIDNIFRTNVSKGMQFYNATGFAPDTEHTISTKTADANGNVNQTWVNHTARTAALPDTTPPSSIIDLTNITYSQTFINFTWLNPPNPDFSNVMLYLNGSFKTSILAPQNYYNFTGLTPDTEYELGTHTVDTSGNVNQTWINKTARTAPIEGTQIVIFPGMTNPPTDPDSDGLYEDINGNGRKDFNDVVLFFNYLEWIPVNQPISSFDFNGNGRIDFNDIIKLFEEL